MGNQNPTQVPAIDHSTYFIDHGQDARAVDRVLDRIGAPRPWHEPDAGLGRVHRTIDLGTYDHERAAEISEAIERAFAGLDWGLCREFASGNCYVFGVDTGPAVG